MATQYAGIGQGGVDKVPFMGVLAIEIAYVGEKTPELEIESTPQGQGTDIGLLHIHTAFRCQGGGDMAVVQVVDIGTEVELGLAQGHAGGDGTHLAHQGKSRQGIVGRVLTVAGIGAVEDQADGGVVDIATHLRRLHRGAQQGEGKQNG